MCNRCDPNGWNRICCNICGAGTQPYISISIATGDESLFPYTTTDLCLKCYGEHGITAALEHNAGCRDVGVTE